LDDDGKRMGEMRYLMRGNVMNIYHTEVDPSLKGRNMGLKLVETGVNYALENGLKILPTCPLAYKVFMKTPEYADVLAENWE
jgi:predicted GNAT family acetyltransferase